MVEEKIIGGEFEIEVHHQYQRKNDFPESVVTYSSGRAALYNILSYLKNNNGIQSVLFPNYLCDSVYKMALKNQMGADFYELDDELNPDYEDVARKYNNTKAVLIINYYGLKDSEAIIVKLRSISPKMLLILDNVQAPYAMLEKTDADCSFSSFRKAFPVADGSWVLSKNYDLEQFHTTNEFAQYKIAASCLKAMRNPQLFKDEVYLNLFHVGEEKIDDNYQTDMTQLSKNILADMEWHRWAILRKRNAEVIINGLKGMGIKPIVTVSENAVPLFVPVYLENRDKIRRDMFSNGIFLPVHWPVEKEYRKHLKRGSDLANHELSIIIDQRYTVRDMKRILGILESNL